MSRLVLMHLPDRPNQRIKVPSGAVARWEAEGWMVGNPKPAKKKTSDVKSDDTKE